MASAEKITGWINVAIIWVIIVVLCQIWISILFAEADTMFAGMLLIALIFVTIYYAILLFYTIRYLKRRRYSIRGALLNLFLIFLPFLLLSGLDLFMHFGRQ